MKRRLKKSVSYSLYGLSFILLVLGVALLGLTTRKITEPQFNYISKGLFDGEQNIKVVTKEDKIIKPFTDSEVKVVKSFYDYKADTASQEKSLLYYENTYMQSTGVSYSNGKTFDVISILSGEVTEVKEDEYVGNSITITHENGITSVYQSVGDITVKKGDKVAQGDKIATSSTSGISSDLNNHLYFELIVKGQCVDPEKMYEKLVSEV